MNLKQLDIKISENDWAYLVTTSIDDWIYAEGDSIEDALINFLDVFKIVKDIKWQKSYNLEKTEDNLFSLPVSI